MDAQNLGEQFRERLILLYHETGSVVHYPRVLMEMVQNHGGIEAAKLIIQDMTCTFEKLWEAQRLDLSVEAVVLEPQWAELFEPDDLNIARQRLTDAGYLQ